MDGETMPISRDAAARLRKRNTARKSLRQSLQPIISFGTATSLSLLLSASTHAQEIQDNSGADGADGSNAPLALVDGQPGGNGGSVLLNNNSAIFVDGPLVVGRSNGGDGGDGLESPGQWYAFRKI